MGLTPGMTPGQPLQYGQSGTMPFGGGGPNGPPGGRGGGGNFPTGQGGPLYQMRTGGFGTMPAGASGYSQALRSRLNPMKWAEMGRQISPSQFQRQEGEAEQANVQYQQEQEQFGRDQQGQQRLMWMQRNKVFEQFLKLLQGAGSQYTGGGDLVGMPVQPDPNILAGMEHDINEEFEPIETEEARISGAQNRSAYDATARAQSKAEIAGRKSAAMSRRYLPAQQATVAGYGPGLRSREIAQGGQQNLLQMVLSMMRA